MRSKLVGILSTLLALLLLSVPVGASAVRTSPLVTLRKSNEEVRALLRQQKNGDASAEQKTKVKKIVNGFLDYTELAKRSLATQWDKMSETARTEFVTVFRDLIERNYVKQLRSNVDYNINYKDEALDGSEATVHSVVEAQRKGRSADITIDYKLSLKDDRWMVYDVVTDDVSLLRNYRTQFARIITREGYPALLGKMKKKLAETTD